MKETKVLLITGYLGSGKTTLLNKILNNNQGIRFAVIVNDIGEVNIDADLIQKGGVVDQQDDSLVALQNGCICCSLKMDLVLQLRDLMASERFDYIVIEASGICEPSPIAQTICAYQQSLDLNTFNEAPITHIPVLDNICSVVDALRIKDEFACGLDFTGKVLPQEDIANLVIEQIEFCNTILLNKADEVTPEELGRIKSILHTIQPQADIITCNYCEVDFGHLLDTCKFDFESVATSAKWIEELDKPHHEHEDEHEHHHHDGEECHDENCPCHHHHHHGHSHGDEYGISTFVYYRRQSFDTNKFDRFVSSKWPENVIRAKGICYFSDNPDMTYLFEQAGVQKKLTEAGLWFATAPQDELEELMRNDPSIMNDWDEKYGDRMAKIVFIGQHLDKEQISKDLDECLVEIF